jgi:hypothetical protein
MFDGEIQTQPGEFNRFVYSASCEPSQQSESPAEKSLDDLAAEMGNAPFIDI